MMFDWIEVTTFGPVHWLASVGPVHWLAFVALVAFAIYPIGTLLRRIGFSPLWSILIFVPIVNVVAIWILALVEWPEDQITVSPLPH